MKKIIVLSTIIFLAQSSFAQGLIIKKAKIEFERTVNAWADLRGDFAEQIKKNTPEYSVSYFNFESDGSKAIYKPGKEVASASSGGMMFFRSSPASDNIVYSDYGNKTSISQKKVFDKTYLIEDSLRNAKWKITNDFREIAGFNCRRATTVIMDSVFVVAFYTDQIMIPGGPESFNELPGMILGLVINRLHTTWYATKVDLNSVNGDDIQPPKAKAEKITPAKLTDVLKNLFSGGGGMGNNDKIVWSVLI